MELYVLDSLLRRTAVVDSFDSVVWTERYNDVGDMTMNIHSTLANRNQFVTGTKLAMNKSNRVMTIETVEDKMTQDGSKTLVITASSLEILFDDRVARADMANGNGSTIEPNLIITGFPSAIARTLFSNIMITGSLDPGDVLPFYAAGNMYPADTIAEPTTNVTMTLTVASLLATLKTICQTYDLGFRLTRNLDNSQLFFNIYAGNDRTTQQTTLPAVVFAPNLDNLLNSSYLTSTKQYKNVAYVVGADSSLIVYGNGVDPTTSGFDRRVLFVNANDLKYPDRTIGPAYTITAAQQASIKVAQGLTTTTQLQNNSLGKLSAMQRLFTQDGVNISAVLNLVGTTLTAQQKTDITAVQTASNNYNPTEDTAYNALLTARGLQELAKANNITALDGQIPQVGSYKYDTDYFLGDILEVRNEDGVVNQVRVTEQIFTQDATGEKSYPTLSSRLVIKPGVWASWDALQQWADPADTVFWSSLP